MSDAEKKDRSAAMVPGGPAADTASPSTRTSGGSAADGGLAGALASALAARKAKVSNSGMYTLLAMVIAQC